MSLDNNTQLALQLLLFALVISSPFIILAWLRNLATDLFNSLPEWAKFLLSIGIVGSVMYYIMW